MWKALRSLTLKGEDNELPNEKEGEALTSEPASEPQPAVETELKPPICHFLRLPPEIRLQIYAYTGISGHTIEVLYLPIIQTSQGLQYFRTYSTNPIDHDLLFRLETAETQRPTKPTPRKPSPPRYQSYGGPAMCMLPSRRTHASSAAPLKRSRCFSVHGLFAVTSVCRQVRAETQVLVYAGNGFAFSDANYDYSGAIRAFTQGISGQERAAVRTVCWPLTNVLVYQRSLRGGKLEEPDRSCREEFAGLKGLEKVVLRYHGSEFDSIRVERSEAELEELKELLAGCEGRDYAVEREHRRTLAVRAMKGLLAREDVEVQCERTWRASF